MWLRLRQIFLELHMLVATCLNRFLLAMHFMKWILMTWTDEECLQILQNCFAALPAGGKLIACEPVLPTETDSSSRTRALLENDIFVMTMYRTQGRGRSEREFERFGLKVGFKGLKAVYLDPFYTVLVFSK